ncbi:MAG: Gfo/Idh/MocA family oxidoreductase [Planctomycetes bacterium]|nr:Gfo/Idh/MocA family oxidoreductase [Planctomycetota bacterium]
MRLRPPSRRDFLLGSSAATASLLALARGALGQETPPAPPAEQPSAPAPPPRPEPQLKIGVIGVGGMGNGHCERFLALHKEGKENVRVVALADVCKPHLDKGIELCAREQSENGETFPVQGFRDYRELLKLPDVQGVLIASPEHWHSQMAVDAIRAGKDVYVEKPMTLRLDQAFEVWREQRGSDRIVQVGTQYVMRPKYAEARRLIQSGAIGHPVSSQTGYCRNSKSGEWNYYHVDPAVQPGEMLDWEAWCGLLGPQPFDSLVFHRWRRYKRWSTGIIGDLLVHQIAPLLMAIDPGWPVRVSAIGGHYVDKAMENHDQVHLIVQFEKEHTMEVLGSTCNALKPDEIVRGHKANLLLTGTNCDLKPEPAYQDGVEEQSAKFENVPDQDLLRMDWLQSMRTRQAPASPVELATKVMVIVDLATRALWEGGSWGFSPASLTTYRA